MLLRNHIEVTYNLKYHLWIYSTLKILIPCPQSLQPFCCSLYVHSAITFVPSQNTQKSDCVLFRDAVMNCHLLTIVRLTYPLFHPSLSLLIILSIYSLCACSFGLLTECAFYSLFPQVCFRHKQ